MLGYNNISALRQQLKPTHRVHGIFEGKDWAPNSRFIEISPRHLSDLSLLVIPDYSKFMSVVFISHTIKKLIECIDALYARPHVQKCKRPSNELFHALSKSLSTRLVLYSHLTLVHRAAALATGCQVSIEYKLGSAFDIRQNKALGTPHKYFTKN